MPSILAVSHASPKYSIAQADLGEKFVDLFLKQRSDLPSRLVREVFKNSRIESRSFLMPLEWYGVPHSMVEKNRAYIEAGLPLLCEASRKVLQAANIEPSQVNHLIFVSTTGLATPSLDVHLMNQIGLSRNATRIPIWGLGCGGGAAGLARAMDHCLAHPKAVVLLTALETCTINFVSEDQSKRNLVAMSLFSDCCAAVVVVGDQVKHSMGHRPQMVASFSDLSPGTMDIAGWDITENGFELILSPELPLLAQKELKGLFERFIHEQGLEAGQVEHYLFHPGSSRVLDTIKNTLSLTEESLRWSEQTLREFGNISSVSVLVVLEKWLEQFAHFKSSYALVGAFGPGYSTEMVLVKV